MSRCGESGLANWPCQPGSCPRCGHGAEEGAWACEDAGQCLADQLRARLAEVEAERDKALNQARHWKEQEAKQRRLHHEQGEWKHRALAAELAASDVPALRARLAEVEAERDEHRNERHRLMKLISVRESAWDAAEARLAGVMAEDFEAHCDCGKSYVLTGEVRAVARGEGDRPAIHEKNPEDFPVPREAWETEPHRDFCGEGDR